MLASDANTKNGKAWAIAGIFICLLPALIAFVVTISPYLLRNDITYAPPHTAEDILIDPPNRELLLPARKILRWTLGDQKAFLMSAIVWSIAVSLLTFSIRRLMISRLETRILADVVSSVLGILMWGLITKLLSMMVL
jgi:hypothetical protein